MYGLIFIILCSLTPNTCDDSDNSVFPSLPVAPVNAKNELCKSESGRYFENLNNLTLWAYQMWDATAKSTTGSLQGSIFQMGDWDECIKVKAPFQVQYCLAVLQADISWLESHKDPFTLEHDPNGSVLHRILNTHDISQWPRDKVNVGWCVPASCTAQDLGSALNDHLKHAKTKLIERNVTYKGVVLEKMCFKQGEVPAFTLIDIIFCVILAIFVFIVLIATIYEFKLENELNDKEKQDYKRHISGKILIGFSARKNFIDLSKADEGNSRLSSLYGLRTVAIFMIILGHRFGTFTSGPILNSNYIEEQYRTIAGAIVFHGDLFVDTFFVLSGLLVTYGLLVQYQKKYVHPVLIIFLRYVRLTPLYAFVIFYYVTLLKYTGSGALWKLIMYSEWKDCQDNWWTNLLYVNNYVNEDHICMTQTWYLACDYHYFIIAIVLAVIFQKRKTLGFTLFILCFILSMAVPFVITIIYLRPALLLFYPLFLNDPKAHPDFILTYIKSHTRATPYCVGMIAGYIYYKYKDSDKRLPKFASHTITLVSIVLVCVGLVSGVVFYNPYHEYDALESSIFAGLNRLAWSFGTIGLLLTASYGHTSAIQKILSWHPFIPLSKLVYGAYLMHMTFQFRSLAMTSGPQTFDIFTLICLATGDIAMAFISGFILYILIETPMRKLAKELFAGPMHKAAPPESNSTQDRVHRENDSRL